MTPLPMTNFFSFFWLRGKFDLAEVKVREVIEHGKDADCWVMERRAIEESLQLITPFLAACNSNRW